MKRAAALAMIAGLASPAAAIDMYLVQTEDLFSLHDQVDGSNVFDIGNNPSAMAFDGNNLYVGGYDNVSAAWLQVTKIEDIFGNRAFRAMVDNTDPLGATQDRQISTRRPASDFQGWIGIDFAEGAGLVMNWDGAGFGPEGQTMIWDVETQLNPIPLASSPSGNSLRGVAPAAWDPGPDGTGYDFDNDGTNDGPAAAVLDFQSDPTGPFGLFPSGPDALSGGIGDTFYEPLTGGPVIGLDPGTGLQAPLGGTIWRGLDFSPDGSTIVAAADGDLVIATRDSSNVVTSRVVVPDAPGTNTSPFIQGQNVEFVDNWTNGAEGVSPSQDFVLFNRRLSTAGGQALFGNVEAYDVAGNALPLAFLNGDGSAFDTSPGTAGFVSFSWHEGSQILAMCDFSTRQVYLFSPESAAPSRLCGDVNNDGSIGPSDFTAWLFFFNNPGEPGAERSDVNNNGIFPEPADFTAWLGIFNNQPGPNCP